MKLLHSNSTTTSFSFSSTHTQIQLIGIPGSSGFLLFQTLCVTILSISYSRHKSTTHSSPIKTESFPSSNYSPSIILIYLASRVLYHSLLVTQMTLNEPFNYSHNDSTHKYRRINSFNNSSNRLSEAGPRISMTPFSSISLASIDTPFLSTSNSQQFHLPKCTLTVHKPQQTHQHTSNTYPTTLR